MHGKRKLFTTALFLSTLAGALHADSPSSYLPVDIKEDFQAMVKRMETDKPLLLKQHDELLNQRYALSNKPSETVTMTGGKPVQNDVRIKLPVGVTWDMLTQMTPEEKKGLVAFMQAI